MKKDAEWAMHHKDVLGAGAKKRRKIPSKESIRAVIKEFQRGTLNSGSGHRVTSLKQAKAIALSEVRKRKNAE